MRVMTRTDLDQPNLEDYRRYLYVLTDMKLNPRLRVKEDVSDVVQVALINAHLGVGRYRGKTEQELRGWLKRILENTITNLAKKYTAQKRDIRLELSIDQQIEESADRLIGELPDDRTSPPQQALRKERGEKLVDALAALADQEYRVVVLKHIHGWTIQEISQSVGCSPEAVAGLLRRGLRKLRKYMTETDDDR